MTMNCPLCGALMDWLNGSIVHDPPINYYQCRNDNIYVTRFQDGTYEIQYQRKIIKNSISSTSNTKCLLQDRSLAHNNYTDLSYSAEGLFIGKYGSWRYTTNHAVPGSGGFSVSLMQKHNQTKDDEYQKQYYGSRRILVVDDEPISHFYFVTLIREFRFKMCFKWTILYS